MWFCFSLLFSLFLSPFPSASLDFERIKTMTVNTVFTLDWLRVVCTNAIWTGFTSSVCCRLTKDSWVGNLRYTNWRAIRGRWRFYSCPDACTHSEAKRIVSPPFRRWHIQISSWRVARRRSVSAEWRRKTDRARQLRLTRVCWVCEAPLYIDTQRRIEFLEQDRHETSDQSKQISRVV